MFTGIVTAVGTVRAVTRNGDTLALTIRAPYDDLTIGESIAVAGACLTVVEKGRGWFRVDAVATTRGRTRFGDVVEGTPVNLERAMQVGDRFGGHFVQGHVDGVGTVKAVRNEADASIIDIEVPPAVADATVPHGSITLDGVSLTVSALPAPSVVQVALIPHTRQVTTLGEVAVGDRLHVEGDLIGKYVHQLVDRIPRSAERGS